MPQQVNILPHYRTLPCNKKKSKYLKKILKFVGQFVTREGIEVPHWTEENPKYLKIDVKNEVLNDFIYTWNNPDRWSNC